MSLSIAAILGELSRIEQQSPEDVAVLMTPLLRALEAVRDGRESPLDRAQIIAITNSLAQTAAQADDIDAAVAIATVAAELEQLPREAFAARPAALPTLPPVAGAGRTSKHPFRHPYRQLLGILGIFALSYTGYLEIQAHFAPGSVTSWLLTGSESLLALALVLGWRRHVLRNAGGRRLTVLALVFALLAGAWAVRANLTLRPQIAAARDAPPTALSDAATASAAATAARATPERTPQARTPLPAEDQPIVFWWLGETPEQPGTRIPAPSTHANASAQPEPEPARAPTRPQQPDAAPPLEMPVPPADNARGADATASAPAPATPMAVYQSLLERDVVVTDVKGGRHVGKLTGISKHGVTLQMEVRMLDQPILASRFYLFDNIVNLRAK